MANVPEYFGSDIFNESVMKERLPKATYKALKKTIDNGDPLDIEVANIVANAMKDWAVEKGCTHYTHWFQPMTGLTAEKLDSFISPTEDGHVIMEFSGKELVKGEPDASSFPSGGLRATFEARGYTAWDPTSYAFIKEKALCIPTAFCSYNGEALDKKTPLLRSMEAINKSALRILKLFGSDATRVTANVGPEQEYFLVDREMYAKREDLILAGRSLYGAPAPKGQELEDHYFGTIKTRVQAYMKDLDEQLWRLGIYAKTKHNEVAPAQHELAPIYGTTNIATDHNQLTMEIMKRTARKHGFKCLLHEKPFAGINGSGKHNNWSLTTDDGINLLDPGKTPHENIQFLLVLTCILKAVDEHADLLRESAADVGNDQRLGGHEAPPAVISVFLGEQLEDVLEQLVSTGTATHSKKGSKLETGVKTLPDFMKDATDRNRTSPFAFTGNKFEFRMVGSRDSVAAPNVVLNTIVAESFSDACDVLEKAEDFDLAVHDLIKEYMTEHQRIIFNGNGYAREWEEEAARRGLPNIPSMVAAVDTLTTPKAIHLFEKFGIFTEAELRSRAEVLYETYAKTINIEALTMVDMANKQIIPAVMKYSKSLADAVIAITEAGGDTYVPTRMLQQITQKLTEMEKASEALLEVEKKASAMERGKEQAFCYHDEVMVAMNALRKPADELEKLVEEADTSPIA